MEKNSCGFEAENITVKIVEFDVMNNMVSNAHAPKDSNVGWPLT